MSIQHEILDYIQTNRVSSVEISDALDKTGVIPSVKSINQGSYSVGIIKYITTWSESNWPLHQQIQDVGQGDMVFVDTFGCNDKAIFGDLVAKFLILYRKVAGVVVNGYVRDLHRLRREGYPIWAHGSTPLGCSNKKVHLADDVKNYFEQRREIYEGGILVADDSGCSLIERSRQTKSTLEKINFIELQEDIWYYCIDTLKMNTFEVICLKEYIHNPSILPEALRDLLENSED